jgi:hypothetical protein
MKTTIKIVLLAAVSAAIAIIAEQLVAITANILLGGEVVLESYAHFTWFLTLAAIIEEISKFWAISFVIRKKFGLEKMKFFVAAFFFGISWGILEICLALFSDPATRIDFQTGNTNTVFSLASIIALHSLTALLMGILISGNIFSGRAKILKILFFPVFVHLLFNFLLIQKGVFTNTLVAISLGITFAIGIFILAFNHRKLA